MEFDLDDKYSYGECRCCLTRGNHRDILQEYYFNGVREVYYNMFVETFNLVLSKAQHLPLLLCLGCVTRLRDASMLRAQAASTEQLLAARDQQTLFIDVPTHMDVKPEITVKVEFTDGDSEHAYDSEFISADDLVAEPVSEPSLVRGEAALLARFKKVPPLPTTADMPRNYARHLDMLKHVNMNAHMISSLQLQDERSVSAHCALSEKSAHVYNAGVLLRSSNMTPFRSKHRAGYPCFYCRSVHDDFEALRKHTQEHNTDELARVLKQTGPECLIVYADITELKCNLCGQDIPNINELKSHLTKKHKKKLIPDVTDRVIPFKINGERYICQICSCKFVTFGSIERHMNGHYRNYVCKECGSGYITKYRLKVHHKSMHVGGSFPCEECGKTFSTHQKHKNHVNTVHKLMKRFKCTKCPERFAEYFRRQKHMVDAHGAAPLRYACNVCERAFDRRYTLSRHLKRDHLEERENECEMCGYRCYTKNELKVHMVKHTGERIHECAVCKKSYARKKTLREHMRIHDNDRRFVCPACGQAFVQKCSLKGHMKTHHFEYSLP